MSTTEDMNEQAGSEEHIYAEGSDSKLAGIPLCTVEQWQVS